MCGIAGILGDSESASILENMVGRLHHRGPDGQGFHLAGPVALGMRRLSIIDVDGGNQPIHNETRRVSVVFNGEIYNFRELKSSLIEKGHQFRTNSDTEVLVHLYEDLGDEFVHRLSGMFALALHDADRNRVLIVRDRVGIKPLYYANVNGLFVFASEIKALLAHPGVPCRPDPAGIGAYLMLRYSPGSESMFAGIHKLPAGHRLIWTPAQGPRIERYWEPRAAVEVPQPHDAAGWQERFDKEFDAAVTRRLVADVPVGAFLSGGVDSSAIVTAMARAGVSSVKTFSIGFDWEGDEVEDARAVAKTLGTEHYEVTCRQDDMALLPHIIWAMDEPVGDPILVPMFLLAKLARQHVKVVLSGEGADELLGGYAMHKAMLQARRLRRLLPGGSAARLASLVLNRMPPSMLDRLFDYPARLGPEGAKRIAGFADLVGRTGDPEAWYLHLISLFGIGDLGDLFAADFGDLAACSERTATRSPPPLGHEFLDRILILQHGHWLADDILTKLDKMTMANSLEGRVPFLDHDLVSLAAALPARLRSHGGRNKIILRNYLQRNLGTAVAQRRKKAFYVPLDRYLSSGPLAEIVSDCLSDTAIKARGWFRQTSIATLRANAATDFLAARKVFSLAMLELWARQFLDARGGLTRAAASA